jgi:hypothetical protein
MPEVYVKQRFTPTEAYLGNPHKGCCTFQHFNGDRLFPGLSYSEAGPVDFPDPAELLREEGVGWGRRSQSVVDGYLPSTVAYCRWFWERVEPQEGAYDFSVVEGALATAQGRGQTLAVRLMAFGSLSQPQIPAWYRDRYPCTVVKFKSADQVVPVHDSPDYFEKWGNCIRAFAEKYDGDPRLESVDIAFIGPWGEGAGDCSTEQCERFVELWQECFPRTPRLALIAGDQFAAGIRSGSGWRCDCFGDLKQAGSATVPAHLSWNHMYDVYPMCVCQAQAQETWRKAPVFFETCWVPMQWYRDHFDLDFIVAQGLKYHGTYFMPKSTRLPEEWMKALAGFCRRLGYRHVVRQTKIDSTTVPGGTMHVDAWIENVGVAPIYRRYDLAVRFRQEDAEAVVRLGDIDIRAWLPGDTWVDESVPVPSWLKPGPCDLSMAIVDASGRPAVRFAVREAYGDHWLPLGVSQVSASGKG